MTTRVNRPGPPLAGYFEVGLSIIGGGFAGLWTARWLEEASPGMRVAVLESEIIGFGASGRNGGFNMTLFGLTMAITAARFGKQRTREAQLYMDRAVDGLCDLV